MTDGKKHEDQIGENDLLKQLAQLLVELALDAEITEYLDYDNHELVANAASHTRTGCSRKTLMGEFSELPCQFREIGTQPH